MVASSDVTKPDSAGSQPARRADAANGAWAARALRRRAATWQQECLAVASSYRRWDQSSGHQRQLAYAGYLAALEREEKAARIYASEVARIAN